MPDDRLFHPRLGLSAKVASLSYLERTVWFAMILVADSFGVLPNLAAHVQGGDLKLSQESPDTIRHAMDRVLEVGLFVAFEHQGYSFCCDPRWQDFQKVRYPRQTFLPAPPPALFARCSRATQVLFKTFHQLCCKSPDYKIAPLPKNSETLPKDFAKSPTVNSTSPPVDHRLERETKGSRLTASKFEETTSKFEETSQQRDDMRSQTRRELERSGFEAFWLAYPRKVGKLKAREAWDRARRNGAWTGDDAVLAAVARQRQGDEWQREGGRFIPHPATWLNQGRWADEEFTSKPLAQRLWEEAQREKGREL